MSDDYNKMNKTKFYHMTPEESKMERLVEFFKYDYNLEILLEFIQKDKKRDKLSLRLIDWFVTNYSKHYGTFYDIKKANGKIHNFLVWYEYQSESGSEKKSYFDPFRRGKNNGKLIKLEYTEGKSLETTIGQLTFFRWAIKNGVIDYVRIHVEEIYKDMCERGTNSKKKTGAKKKRRQLSVSVSKTLGHHKLNISVSFKNKIDK